MITVLFNCLKDLKWNDETNKLLQINALNVEVGAGTLLLLTGETDQLRPHYISLMLILYYSHFELELYQFTGEYR